MWGLSPVAASGGHSSSRCAGLSLSRPLLLRSRGSRRSGSAAVAHGPSRSAACGILPDQGSNPRPLHWQADSQPLRHQGSPKLYFYMKLSFSSIWKLPIFKCIGIKLFINLWKALLSLAEQDCSPRNLSESASQSSEPRLQEAGILPLIKLFKNLLWYFKNFNCICSYYPF